MTILNSYFLIAAVIIIPDEDIRLIIANILLFPMIAGVVITIIGVYLGISKNTWEKKPTNEQCRGNLL